MDKLKFKIVKTLNSSILKSYAVVSYEELFMRPNFYANSDILKDILS